MLWPRKEMSFNYYRMNMDKAMHDLSSNTLGANTGLNPHSLKPKPYK